MLYRLKEVFNMANLKVLSMLSFIVLPVSWGATFQERCENQIVAINECVTIFERVNNRYSRDKCAYEAALLQGFRNKTLESEQVRDSSYLIFSEDIINKLRELRRILSQQNHRNGNVGFSLTYANDLIGIHEIIEEATLMNF